MTFFFFLFPSIHTVQQLLLFLQGKAICQEVENDLDDEESGEGDEDDEDHDFILMDSVTDLIGTLARTFGTNFVNYATPLLEPLGRFLSPNRPHTDRSMAIGCYGELVQGMGAHMGGQHCASMVQIVLVGLRDQHHEVKVRFFFFIRYKNHFSLFLIIKNTDNFLFFILCFFSFPLLFTLFFPYK